MILCCGEALIDMLPRQLPGGEMAFLPVPGGAVFNTAIGLGRLGVETGFFCPLSRDMFGTLLVAALTASSVDISLCPRVDRPATLAFVELEKGQARYHFYNENSALRGLGIADLPVLDLEPQAAFFGGISLTQEPVATAYETLMRRLAGRSVLMFDPNIRPGFIADEAAYRTRMARMMAMADIIKLSDEDFRWLFHGRDLECVASGLLAAGTSVLLITQGGQPALAFTRGGKVEVPVPSTVVVDTVGAGDTFNAGFLTALSRAGLLDRAGLDRLQPVQAEKALELAAAVAAVTVSRAGANPPFASEIMFPV